MSFVIKSDTLGERVYLRITKKGWGAPFRYGLVKTIEEATLLAQANYAGTMAVRAERYISRSFDVLRIQAVKPARVERLLELT